MFTAITPLAATFAADQLWLEFEARMFGGQQRGGLPGERMRDFRSEGRYPDSGQPQNASVGYGQFRQSGVVCQRDLAIAGLDHPILD
jgi:hypothetical protein